MSAKQKDLLSCFDELGKSWLKVTLKTPQHTWNNIEKKL